MLARLDPEPFELAVRDAETALAEANPLRETEREHLMNSERHIRDRRFNGTRAGRYDSGHSRLRRCMKLLSYWVVLIAILPTSCSAPKDYPRTNSTAFPDYPSTSVGEFFEEAAVQHPDESGFAIIRRGRRAFTARVALTELAEKSLDVQYYIWEADATGRILADRLVQAADRGVRVRVLVDDINLSGRDETVASIDAHPNIEIRVFNPFANRDKRAFDFLMDLSRINHRMHNKLMVMDNAVAIVG